MLFDIQEPGQHKSNAAKDVIAVGIDLGTTNSLVAYSINQQPHIIANSKDGKILPSVVTYLPQGGFTVGVIHEGGVRLSSVKRFIGKNIDQFDTSSLLARYVMSEQGDDKSIIFDLGFRKTTPIEVSTEIFRELKARAEEYFGKSVEQVVVTVPAHFDDASRMATKHAAHLAGFQVLRLINEPTAAALAYGLDKAVEGKYIIYDFGGGTFDVSVLNLQKGIFQVLTTGGDVHLGGDDIDYLLVDLIKNQLGGIEFNQQEEEAIYCHACKIKETLSGKDKLNIHIKIGSKSVNFLLKRSEFEKLILPLIERTFKLVQNAIRDAQIKQGEIKGVVLVGGSTRIPLIKAELNERFGFKCLDDINPDEVVALGAAIQAESLTKGSDNLLIDVTPLSLGLEVMGGLNEKIIARNTPLPISVTKEFTTYQDGQRGIQFHIVQGERELVKDCRFLAKFELRNIPSMKAGAVRISVNFTIDVDGILTVSAQELVTGNKHIIDIKPSYGLDTKQIEQILVDSMKNAKQDVSQRLLLEIKAEAQQVIELVNKSLAEDGELLSSEELSDINIKIADLQQAINRDQREQIKKKLQKLEDLIKIFSDCKINKYLNLALQGKNIDDIES